MAEIQPRWEWRTFGEPLDTAERVLADFEIRSDYDSDETYLLSVHSDASVKNRDGLMDVKHLEHVNDDGLEQWLPVMKAGFPLSASDLRSVLASLGVEAPPLDRDEYTLAERFSVLPRVIPLVLLLTGVMVALYGGYATPSETAGLGGLLALRSRSV